LYYTGWQKKFSFSLPVKIQGHSNSFDIAESEYDNQVALSPTNVTAGGIKLKNYVVIKKVGLLYWFLITIYSVK
jgi:hypothetical protein